MENAFAYLYKTGYWLLAIATALAALHVTILLRANDVEQLGMSVLFLAAIASLIWDKRSCLNLNSDIVSSLIGVVLIGIVLIRSLSPTGYHAHISPFISGLGLWLLASGIKRWRVYWKELLVLSLFIINRLLSLLLESLALSTLTAQFSALLLWVMGFEVHLEGTIIAMPTGRVEVYGDCSGVANIIQMFNVAVLFLLIVPVSRLKQIICITIAVLLGFVVNAVRVALMAGLLASSQLKAFHYWHDDDGALFFAMTAVLIFGLICWLLFFRGTSIESDSGS